METFPLIIKYAFLCSLISGIIFYIGLYINIAILMGPLKDKKLPIDEKIKIARQEIGGNPLIILLNFLCVICFLTVIVTVIPYIYLFWI